MKLNQKIINASYKLMETITKEYQWYTDTPEQPFEYSEGSIWLINPETGEWILELEKSGVLWYDYETPDSFYKYLNMERHDFESFIKTWMEDVLNRGVDSTTEASVWMKDSVEDVLKRGVVSTESALHASPVPVEDVLKRGVDSTGGVCGRLSREMEDVLKRGVVSVVRNEIDWDDEIKDVLENGVVTTSPLARVSSMSVQDAIENGKQWN